MNEREDFLKWVETDLRSAEVAIHNGDADPRRALWSTQDPVTVFGAWMTGTTAADAESIFHRLAQQVSHCTAFAYDVLAADAARGFSYTARTERHSATFDSEPLTLT